MSTNIPQYKLVAVLLFVQVYLQKHDLAWKRAGNVSEGDSIVAYLAAAQSSAGFVSRPRIVTKWSSNIPVPSHHLPGAHVVLRTVSSGRREYHRGRAGAGCRVRSVLSRQMLITSPRHRSLAPVSCLSQCGSEA